MQIDEMTRELLIESRIGGRDSEISQLCLRLRPGEIQCPSRAVRVVVKVRELNCCFAIFRHVRREGHLRRSAGGNGYPGAQGENRIQYGTHGSRQLYSVVECHRITHRSA